MKDPFYAGIIFKIERKIAEADRIALDRGMTLTDSQVISVLTKVAGEAGGKLAKAVSPSSPREQVLVELREQLAAVRDTISVGEPANDGTVCETPLPAGEWIAALKCVMQSARMRKGTVPGSRDYLDFLAPFIAQAGRES